MKIKDMFAKKIDREIQGVIIVGQGEEANVSQELEEYVVTRELQKHFADFYSAYKKGIVGTTPKMGVWISGFFGSGKSHFLKILSYLLENRQVGDRKAMDYFVEDKKIVDPMVLADMKLAADTPTDVILFNIDSKSETNGKQNKDAIVNVFLKVFNQMQGFCGSIPHVADLERRLSEEGRYDEFKAAFEEEYGDPWEESRQDFDFIQDSVVDALVSMDFMSEAAARNWCEKAVEPYTICFNSNKCHHRSRLDNIDSASRNVHRRLNAIGRIAMNKTAIKNFAIWARNKLIADIQYRAGLMGITADGIKDPLPQSTGTMEFYDIGTSEPYAISGDAIPQRKKLVEVIRKKENDSNYATAYKYILEEVAYTWFNRLIAIRFMEVNDYLPSHIRVLSSESGKIEPDLVTTPFDAELTFTSAEEETVLRLKTENKLDELFRLLFIKQCNALNEILPALFEKTSDYTELLLNLSVVDREGVVYHLTHDIPEQDFDITHPDENGEIPGQVEIIGWLYQYYNTELNEQVYDGTMSKSKIPQELLPAATTIYTPDWAVRYMVENSLGRIFIDKRKEQGVFADGRGLDEMTWDEVEAKRIANEEEIARQMGWKYYLPEAAQTQEVRQQLDEIQKQSEYKDVRDIKVIDPCMGSGHILVYAFDVLMQMYENDGYSQRDAAQCILENNLFGLDIDERAAQLAYFAVMMKARQYNRRIFSRGIQPHVYAIAESNDIDAYTRDYFANNDPKLKAALDSIIQDLHDAKEYGSILTVAPVDFAALYARMDEVQNDISLHRESALNTILPLIRVAEALAQQYDVVVTNPPYLGSSRFSPLLDKYVKENYADVKSDLSMVMYQAAINNFSKRCGFISFITTSSWMFLSSFERLRDYLSHAATLYNLVDFGTELFDGKVGHNPIVSWVTRKAHVDYKMTAIRLVDYCYSRRDEKEPEFFNLKNRYTAQQSNFSKIPGSPVAYWVGSATLLAFSNQTIGEISEPRMGLTTGNNDY